MIFKGAEKGGFDESLFWKTKGAMKRLIPLECDVIAEPQNIHLWQTLVANRIMRVLPERTASYLLAFTLGIKTEALSELHRYAGTLHLLAVSGFHIAVVAWFAQLLFCKGLIKLFGVSSVVWIYVLLAGSPPGAERAAVMLQVYLLSLMLGRPSSAFNNVSLAGILLLFHNPWNFFDIGWRLSMLAALFLSALGGLMARSWKSAVAASLLVWLVTAPQAAIAFGEVSLAGLLINPVAALLFVFIFPLIILLALPSLAGFVYASYAADAAEFILASWETFSQTVSELLPWSIGYPPSLFALALFVFFAAALGASGFSKVKIIIYSLLLPMIFLLYI